MSQESMRGTSPSRPSTPLTSQREQDEDNDTKDSQNEPISRFFQQQQQHPLPQRKESTGTSPSISTANATTYFFSEPSLSLDDESRVRAPHRVGSTSNNNNNNAGTMNSTMIINAQHSQQRSPGRPPSPGNTSLSSWDSSYDAYNGSRRYGMHNDVVVSFTPDAASRQYTHDDNVSIPTMPAPPRPRIKEGEPSSVLSHECKPMEAYSTNPFLQYLQQSHHTENHTSEGGPRPRSGTTDDSIIMSLSSSNASGPLDQDKIHEPSGLVGVSCNLTEESQVRNALASSPPAAQNSSADDEQTQYLRRQQRQHIIPGRSKKSHHRRQRSGDDAAASLVTPQGSQWIGNRRDNIPMPGSDTRDEIDTENEEDPPKVGSDNRSFKRKASSSRGKTAVVVPPLHQQQLPTFTTTASQSAVLPGTPTAVYGALTPIPQDELAEPGLSPISGQPGPPATPHRPTGGTGLLVQDSPSSLMASLNYSIESSTGSHVNSINNSDESYRFNEDDEETSDDEAANVSANRIVYCNQGDNFDLEEVERRLSDPRARGTYQNVMRPHKYSGSQSPFAHMGRKVASLKKPLHIFLPQSSVIESDDSQKFPTYICPRCNTRQRDFITVNDAEARPLTGPLAYLSLYFLLYVIASLYIFGLQEGWAKLDCIYFAVVTMTTCGLGDFVPTSDINKIICSLFIYVGVCTIGLVLGGFMEEELGKRKALSMKKAQQSSCPNCARIENAHTRRKNAERDGLINRPKNPQCYQSERQFDPHFVHADRKAHYTQPRSHHKKSDSNTSHSEGSHRSRQETQHLYSTPTIIGRKAHDSSLPRTSIDGIESTGSSNSHSSYMLGSPVTRSILKRQSHTRHASFDLNTDDLFQQPGTLGRSRKYSEDLGTSTNRAHETPRPKESKAQTTSVQNDSSPEVIEQMQDYFDVINNTSDGDDDPENGSVSSSVSTRHSEDEELFDDGKYAMQMGRYIFLTFRKSLTNSLTIIFVGALGFWYIEGFTFVDAWYFTTVFLTTTGYGDIVPVTRGGKLFATIYLLIAGSLLLENMARISKIPMQLRERKVKRDVLIQFGDQLDDAALRELASGPLIQRLHLTTSRVDGLDECTREMFALAMLVRLGKVTEEEIRQTFAVFRRLDVNNEGVLNSGSIITGMYKKRRKTMARTASQEALALDSTRESIVSATSNNVRSYHQGLSRYWMGPHGSLHVDSTTGDCFHFDAADVNERTSLLAPTDTSSGLVLP